LRASAAGGVFVGGKRLVEAGAARTGAAERNGWVVGHVELLQI